MTIAASTGKIRFNGDGATTEFDFSFSVFGETDIEVYEILNSTSVATLQTITTHYTVALNTTSAGGTITFVTAPANTKDVLILRNLGLTQGVAIPTESNIPEKQLENALDRSTILSQQLNEALSRSIKFPITTESTDGVLPEPVDGKALLWDGATGTLKNSVADFETGATAAAASAVAAAASALAAAASETAAADSETAAGLSETASGVSETNSAASAITAQDARNKLTNYANDAAFVSAKGSAAASGDTYFNTTTSFAKVYDGTSWKDIPKVGGTMCRLFFGKGYGTTDTKIRRFESYATDFTTTNSAGLMDVDFGPFSVEATVANGTVMTVNTAGVYHFGISDHGNINTYIGLSVNSSQLTTDIESINDINRVILSLSTNTSNVPTALGVSLKLEIDDEVRMHTQGLSGGNDDRTTWTITTDF